MKNTIKKFQETMMAATFAEAGEWETAREMTPEVKLSRKLTWLDRVFAAITFAESGLHNEALCQLEPVVAKSKCATTFADELGLGGARLVYGTITI